MKLFGLVSCFPSFLETDKENFFETVNFGKTVQDCHKKLHNSTVAESVNTSRKEQDAVFIGSDCIDFEMSSSNL